MIPADAMTELQSEGRAPFRECSPPHHGLFKDLTGRRFSRLRVTAYAGRIGKNHAFLCLCDCGGHVVTRGYSLTGGATKSCGCPLPDWIRATKTTHGQSKTPEYRVWRGMITRCFNTKRKDYCRYGGRGITVCDRWINGDGARSGFECFYADIGPRPSAGFSIERKLVNGNYEPENVIWATAFDQEQNKRGKKRIEFRGKRLTVGQWAVELGMPYSEVDKRLRRGWSVERALTQPLRRSPK